MQHRHYELPTCFDLSNQGGDPARAGVAMTDLTTGLYAYGAIMAALLHRAKTGQGQRVECNLLASQVLTLYRL